MQHSEEPVPKRHKPDQDNDFKVAADVHQSCIAHSWESKEMPSVSMSSQEKPLHTAEVSTAANTPSDRHQLTGEAQAQSHEDSAAVASTPNDTTQPLQGKAPSFCQSIRALKAAGDFSSRIFSAADNEYTMKHPHDVLCVQGVLQSRRRPHQRWPEGCTRSARPSWQSARLRAS